MSKRSKAAAFGTGTMAELGRDLDREDITRKFENSHKPAPTKAENDRLRCFVDDQIRRARILAGNKNARRCVVVLGALEDAIRGK